MNESFDFPAIFRQAGLGTDGNSVVGMLLLALGALLLVARHPLRREFSEAFDFLITRRLPLWITLLALGLEVMWGNAVRDPVRQGGTRPAQAGMSGVADVHVNVRPLVDATLQKIGSPLARSAEETAGIDWEIAAPLLTKSLVLRALSLLHEAIRPLPLAVLLPVWLVMATVGLSRYPYRYQREKLRTEQRTVLWMASVLTMVWSGVYVFSFSTSPAARVEMEAVMLPATVIMAALAAAVYQVWLARSVVQWAEPGEEQRNARDEVIARWQNVLWLAAFNGAWTAIWLWMEGATAPWLPWSGLVEILFAFAPLPLAVAMTDGRSSLAVTGGAALRILGRSWMRLLVWTLSAMLLLTAAEIAIELVGALALPPALQIGGGENGGHILQTVADILMRGLLHAWLVPAAILAMWKTSRPR